MYMCNFFLKVTFLTPFHNLSVMMQASTYTTISMVYPAIIGLCNDILQREESDQSDIARLKTELTRTLTDRYV